MYLKSDHEKNKQNNKRAIKRECAFAETSTLINHTNKGVLSLLVLYEADNWIISYSYSTA